MIGAAAATEAKARVAKAAATETSKVRAVPRAKAAAATETSKVRAVPKVRAAATETNKPQAAATETNRPVARNQANSPQAVPQVRPVPTAASANGKQYNSP